MTSTFSTDPMSRSARYAQQGSDEHVLYSVFRMAQPKIGLGRDVPCRDSTSTIGVIMGSKRAEASHVRLWISWGAAVVVLCGVRTRRLPCPCVRADVLAGSRRPFPHPTPRAYRNLLN